MSLPGIFSLSTFDYIMLSIVIISTLFALYRGLMSSLLSLIGWIISFYVGLKFGDEIFVPFIENYTSSAAMAGVISSGIILLIMAIFIAVINSVINGYIKEHFRGLLDRSFGLVFGFFRGCLIASVIFYFITLTVDSLKVADENKLKNPEANIPDWSKNSETIILLKRGADIVAKFIPKSFEDELHQTIIESTEESGEIKLPSTKVNEIQSINKILSILPSDVLNNISDEDLITLQDTNTTPEMKAQILEKVANEYQQYISNRIIGTTNQAIIAKQNKEYHNTMSRIEDEIIKLRQIAKE